MAGAKRRIVAGGGKAEIAWLERLGRQHDARMRTMLAERMQQSRSRVVATTLTPEQMRARARANPLRKAELAKRGRKPRALHAPTHWDATAAAIAVGQAIQPAELVARMAVSRKLDRGERQSRPMGSPDRTTQVELFFAPYASPITHRQWTGSPSRQEWLTEASGELEIHQSTFAVDSTVQAHLGYGTFFRPPSAYGYATARVIVDYAFDWALRCNGGEGTCAAGIRMDIYRSPFPTVPAAPPEHVASRELPLWDDGRNWGSEGDSGGDRWLQDIGFLYDQNYAYGIWLTAHASATGNDNTVLVLPLFGGAIQSLYAAVRLMAVTSTY